MTTAADETADDKARALANTASDQPNRWRNRIVGEGEADPEQLLANPDNARIHPKAQQDAMESVLDSIGFIQRVIINQRTQHVVDGHMRVAIAISRGEPTIPVLYVDLSEEEERLALAVFDPIAAMAGTDRGKLQELLGEVRSDDKRMQDLMASIRERERIVDTASPGRTDPDATPAKRKITKIKTGDLFQLGRHRLLCGDSTKAASYECVLDGRRAALALTDPPYGVGEQYQSFEDSRENLSALIAGFLPLTREHAEIVLLTSGNKNHRLYPEPTWTLCWITPAGSGRCPWGFSCWQPVLAYGADPYLGAGKGSYPDSLNKTESSDNTLDHPCPKPVGVWSWFMNRGSVAADALVLDPFAGSGTGLIAAETLGRVFAGIEIDPSYCQVIIDRWQAFTGQVAEKIGSASDAPADSNAPAVDPALARRPVKKPQRPNKKSKKR